MPEEPEVLHEGRFLSLVKTGTWEYATRGNATGVVGILAVTKDQEVLLVEQFRPPLGRNVIELPAGLAGDESGGKEEPLLSAARRELREETGYEAATWQQLLEGPSSAGLTDELVTVFLATELVKVSESLGVDGEEIALHKVPLVEIDSYLESCRGLGKLIDFKIRASLHAARLQVG